MPKTAIERLNTKKEIKIIPNLAAGIPWAKEGSSMVVSTPLEVDSILKKIPKNKIVTITEIREFIAQKHNTDITCPISTGIFINMSAAAAEEYRLEGVKNITPYWRVLKTGGMLNEKFPNGLSGHKKWLEKEGFQIEEKTAKKFFVIDYNKFLTKLN